jgi:hypothetical protein
MNRDRLANPYIVLAKPFYRGGAVIAKGKKVGMDMLVHYHVKDVDSVPAMLAPGEFVLTKRMQNRVKKAFQRSKQRPIRGL